MAYYAFMSAFNAFIHRPWLGYGPGNSSVAMELWAVSEEIARTARYYSPHNMYVRVLAELGILGFAPYVVGYTLWHAMQCLRYNYDVLLKTMAVFLMALLVHRVFVHGLPGGLAYDNMFLLILLVVVASYSRLASVRTPAKGLNYGQGN